MASIAIQRHHQLGRKRVRTVVTRLAKTLEIELDARCHWQGDELRFERTGASGCVRVADDQVEVEIELGLLLRPLKKTIAARINEELDSLLGPVA
jgi:putative polyhydroxyalkanoate system protein